MVLTGELPDLQPALITHRITHDQHRMHICAFPAHPAAFETGLDDQFVRTFRHSRTDRSADASIRGVLHQAETFAQIAQMFSHRFLRGVSLAQSIGHVDECDRSTMFEHV